MTLDLNTMPTSSSPLALLAAQPAPAASDEFATLFDLGAATPPPAETPTPAAPAPAMAVSADLAIAQADALVSALTPETGPIKRTSEAPPAGPVPMAIQQIVGQPLRRPSALPDETARPRSGQKPRTEEAGDEVDGPLPVILVLPEPAPPVVPTALPIESPSAAPQADATPVADAPQAQAPGAAATPVAPAKAAQAEFASGNIAHLPDESVPASKTLSDHDLKASDAAATAPELSSVPSFTFVDKATAVSPAPDIAAAADAAPADPMMERQLDLVRDEQWLGELAHDIASTSGDKDRLAFRLMPHQLGRLDIDLSRTHNGLSLTIRTESDSAQAILSAAQPRLADEIRAQGLKLADTQMFSGDARQSPGQESNARPAPLIESVTTPTETAQATEEERRDGRYA